MNHLPDHPNRRREPKINHISIADMATIAGLSIFLLWLEVMIREQEMWINRSLY